MKLRQRIQIQRSASLLRRCAQLFLLVLALGLAMPAAWSQADQAALTGQVQDASGAAVPNAQLTLTNTDTGLSLSTTTDSSGNYVFSPIKIGNYKVDRQTAPGFSTDHPGEHPAPRPGSRRGQPQAQDRQRHTDVTVTEAPPLLQTEEGSTGQVIESKTINDTPLNGRNWVFIAQLTAGVAPANGARGQKGGDFNANGQRAEQNNYIMDGVDNNVNVVDFFNGASYVVRPPPDALAEFKVQTGSYSSEFGHSAGAVVNASIKSGTNHIHGSLWEYIRNDAFDVREFFQGSSPIAKYRQNQFGATLGLPIFKDKLFFFGDVEANRIVFGRNHVRSHRPHRCSMRTGNFSELLNPALVNGNTDAALRSQSRSQRHHADRQQSPGPAARRHARPRRPEDPEPLPRSPTSASPARPTTTSPRRPTLIDNTFQWDVRADWNISSQGPGLRPLQLQP